MDRSKVKDLVERSLLELATRYGVPHWTYCVRYDRPFESPDEGGSETPACIWTYPNYEQATIDLNCSAIEDVNGFESAIGHELTHVVLSAFDVFKEQALSGLDRAEAKRMELLFAFCCEHAVIRVQAAIAGHKEFYRRPGPVTLPLKRKRKA